MATSFAPKNVVLPVYVVITGLLMLMFLRLGPSLAKQPNPRINLPNKEHWLAPERRAQTFEVLGRRLQWFGTATLVLLFDIFQQILTVGLGQARTLEHAPWSIGIYVAFSVVWVIALSARFRRAD